jgi:hypothetical protein
MSIATVIIRDQMAKHVATVIIRDMSGELCLRCGGGH